ncbi:MAG: hypothetical protein RBR35_07770 [Salinivirgaceae bacterium]|nr:hypothetical protein [Salinivirgaceae bacterium]
MEQRDLLKDQIDQLGKVLAKILSNFLGLKSNGKVSQGIELTNQSLQSELDINIDKLTTLSIKELPNYLKSRKLNAGHLEILSEYLKEIGIIEMNKNRENAELYLRKAIELLNIADEISKTISLDRMNKKCEIEDLL